MKLSLYSARNLACLSASAWRQRKRGKHGVLFLFKVPLFLLGFGAYREPSCGAQGPCWSLLIRLLPWSAASTQGWWALPWLSFPALVKIHREVGNGFMIKAELDLYQRSFPSWKSEPLENSLDPRGRLLDCPHRPAWKEKGAGPQIGPAFNVNPPRTECLTPSRCLYALFPGTSFYGLSSSRKDWDGKGQNENKKSHSAEHFKWRSYHHRDDSQRSPL